VRVGVNGQLLSLYLPSRTKLQSTLQLRGQIDTLPLFHLHPCVLYGSDFSTTVLKENTVIIDKVYYTLSTHERLVRQKEVGRQGEGQSEIE
jgi:hypothetical protein